jgi:hypothetical protein
MDISSLSYQAVREEGENTYQYAFRVGRLIGQLDLLIKLDPFYKDVATEEADFITEIFTEAIDREFASQKN